jgi:Tfp pilus assembly protein PilN
MITINLLPVAAIRRQLKGRAVLTGYGLYLLLIAAAMFAGKVYVLDLGKTVAEKNRTVASLNHVSDEVTRATAVTDSAVTRWKQLAAIVELEERRRDQTRLLVEMEALLPKTNAWLVGLNHGDGLMSLEGIATDKETVSQFLTRLENAAHIDRASVTLVRLSQDLIINGIKLTKFSVNARTRFPEPAILDRGLDSRGLDSRRLDPGNAGYGLPSRDEFVNAVRAVDEKLAAGLSPGGLQ